MKSESKGRDGLTKNPVSLSENEFVDEISDKLTRARRFFSLRDYDSCGELARQVLEIDPENSAAIALVKLTSINRPSRKRLQKIVDPQLPKEDQTRPQKVESQAKRRSVKFDNVSSEPIRGKSSKTVRNSQFAQERPADLHRGAIIGHPSEVISENISSERQPPLPESSRPGEGDNAVSASKSQVVPEHPPYSVTAVTPNPDDSGSADELREKTIAALVEFLNEKNKSSTQLGPQAAERESPEIESKVTDAPNVSPPKSAEPRPRTNDQVSIETARHEAINRPKLWGAMGPVRTPESRAEDYMASAVSYYHERRLPEALAAAREALRLVSGHEDARDFVNFIQKRIHERKKRKWWAVAMLLVWLIIGSVILAYRGRDGTVMEIQNLLNMKIHNLLNWVQPATANKDQSGPNDIPSKTPSPATSEGKSIPPAQSKPVPNVEDKIAKPSKEEVPTTPQMKSSATELSPEDVVKTFYTRAAADDFAGAWELAGPGFRQQLKSFEQFRNAQRSLESIEFLRAERTSETDRRVTVRIETIATHINRIDHCKGSLSLVRKGPNRSWVLNWANGIHCESQARNGASGPGK